MAYLTIAERRNFSGALRVVFGSEEELQDSLWSTCGMVLRNSISPEHLGTDGEVLGDIFPTIRGKTIFLFLGRLNVKQKGLDFLVDSFSRATVDRNDVILVLAGPDERGGEQEVRDLVAKHGLSQKVLFTGYVTGGLKASLLAAADVFLLPSRSEGASMALVEALYMGLPVIVTPGAGLTREIVERRMGIVAAPGEGLTSAIKKNA